MRKAEPIARQDIQDAALCPRCGAEAEVYFQDQRKLVEVICEECGRFEMLRTEFDQLASELVGPGERE